MTWELDLKSCPGVTREDVLLICPKILFRNKEIGWSLSGTPTKTWLNMPIIEIKKVNFMSLLKDDGIMFFLWC